PARSTRAARATRPGSRRDVGRPARSRLRAAPSLSPSERRPAGVAPAGGSSRRMGAMVRLRAVHALLALSLAACRAGGGVVAPAAAASAPDAPWERDNPVRALPAPPLGM